VNPHSASSLNKEGEKSAVKTASMALKWISLSKCPRQGLEKSRLDILMRLLK